MGRIYYGWYVVGVAMVTYMLLIGISVSAFGAFVVPVSRDLHLSRADANSGLILMNLGAACLAPLVGRALDRLPLKLVLMAAVTCFAAALVGLGLSKSLLLSAGLLLLPLAVGVSGAGTLGMTVLMARWFEAQRGRAIALGMVGMSLGGVIAPLVAGGLIERVGWRATLVILGCATATILLLLILGPATAAIVWSFFA